MALQGIEVEGIIIKEYPPKEGVSSKTGNAWKTQDFVIQTKDQFPRTCLFNVFGADKLEQFNLHQGDNVRVWLDINARAWQDRYFNDIRAFRVDHIDPNAAPAPVSAESALMTPAAAPTMVSDPLAGDADDANDLPF